MKDFIHELLQLALSTNVIEIVEIDENSWVMMTDDGLHIQLTSVDNKGVLSCAPFEETADERWYELLLQYNALLSSTGGVVMGLNQEKSLVIQLPFHAGDPVQETFLGFIKTVIDWRSQLMSQESNEVSQEALRTMIQV